MTAQEQKKAAREFSKRWEGKGYEKGESQKFWISLLRDVFDIQNTDEYISFEDPVAIDTTSYIDGFIPSTKVLIEQKSTTKELNTPIVQSNGMRLTPFEQAQRYCLGLPYSKTPRWIITSNFRQFYIYDRENPNSDPSIIYLKDLEREYYRLSFLKSKDNTHIVKEKELSIEAGKIVGMLYNALLNQYKNPQDEHTLKDLNVLCVRLVFCFYAEDANIFGKRSMFYDYLEKYKTGNFRDALIKLFKVLDQKPQERDPYLEEDLAQFPYVNGGLFENENVVIPTINEEIIDIILNKASANFDWSGISPTIFGGVFESTLNPDTRSTGGMHYTSIINIHKVIDPLFMNDLYEQFEAIKEIKVYKTRKKKLEEFQNYIASLEFFDPAAGSGNFLTETYLSLRKMENQILSLIYQNQIVFNDHTEGLSPIKVSLKQFHGIEINDFAVSVAKTALWIAESQMLQETSEMMNMPLDFLPLKSFTNITEGNSLDLDWETLVNKNTLNYIIGNPPFVGYKNQSDAQKKDIEKLFRDKNGKLYPNAKKMDYVASWFFKSAKFIKDTSIECSFVSTCSITQGELVYDLWSILINIFDVKINFAHRTFSWESEALNKAAVHCVIIGFSNIDRKSKYIFTDALVEKVEMINPYLVEGKNILVKSTNKPLYNNVMPTIKGSSGMDNQFLSDVPKEKMNQIIKEYPESNDFFKRIIGADEFINGKERYCLWLKDVPLEDYIYIKPIMKIIDNVREWRLNSKRENTIKAADKPQLFTELRQPSTDFLIIPVVSSMNRRYIPIGYMTPQTIVLNVLLLVPNATLYDFGILTSNVHMSWMRAVGGRLKSDYRYSGNIIYNTFPWPNPSDKQRIKIHKTAEEILNARKLFEKLTYADLYNDRQMPNELRVAHRNNDRAVMEAYGFDWRIMSESECVAELLKLYEMKLNE